MKFQEICSLLENVKKNGNGYTARCPAHQDKENSLSISPKTDKLLLNCFAGCDTSNIVSALGLTMQDLFFEAYQDKPTSEKRPYKEKQAKKITAVYPYTDESGELLYENVRFEPKDFRQRRYDADGKTVWSLNGTQRVPYRLPELIEGVKEGADIFVCEGEKDADNLRSLGFAATSFKNWKPEFNQYLKSSHVCLIQDHDKAGLKQANDACKMLYENIASLKVIDLFQDESLPEKHGNDFSDWFEDNKKNGLSIDEIAEKLCILTDNAGVWKQGETINLDTEKDDFPSLFVRKSANDWIAQAKLKPIPKMLFDEFWFENEVCIFFGDTGKGKTILAVQIADAISRNEAINNFKLEAEKQKILYFDFELSEKQFEKRYSTEQADIYTNHFLFDENFQRIEINRFCETPKRFTDFESYLFFSLEYEIVASDAKVLIVDIIKCFKSITER